MPLLLQTMLRWLIIIVIFIILVSILNFWLTIRPFKFKSTNTPDNYGLSYERVSFQTSDNLTLNGWFIPQNKSKATIIILHGYPFDKGNILSLGVFLHKDYNLFLYDSRYFGESEGTYTTVGWHERKDLEGAINYLKTRKELNHAKLGVIGFSLGAATALMTQSMDIKAYVIDSGFASGEEMLYEVYRIFPGPLKWPFVQLTKVYARFFLNIDVKELAPERAIATIKAPILIIHGDKDWQINVKNAYRLYDAADKETTELWIVKGADHGFAHAKYPKEYEHRVRTFFTNHLK
ncbi:alpha/beta hydrolase [Candidatus Woesearchaeota archaeon]|nr:alpha/beta hydrolase [Candidatus Woesearchaeota archaeon]